jgi:hypothetical protein
LLVGLRELARLLVLSPINTPVDAADFAFDDFARNKIEGDFYLVTNADVA